MGTIFASYHIMREKWKYWSGPRPKYNYDIGLRDFGFSFLVILGG